MSNTPVYDVLVVGAGPAGLVAATQAARAGASVLLVEKSALIGGTTVLNGVNFPGLFHAWGQQVVRGIGWELVRATAREDGQTLPDFENYKNRPHYELQILVNPATYTMLADQLVLASGAQLRLHTLIAGAEYDSHADRWKVSLCGKEGLESLIAATIIDCTGDANVVGLLGLPRQKNKHLQPGTLALRTGGYELEALDRNALEAAFLEAVRNGEMERSDFSPSQDPVYVFLKIRGANAMHVSGIDAATSAGKTEAELKARRTLFRIQRFLRAQPGLENFHIESFAPECGIRETYTIDGEVTISGDDYTSGRLWNDAYCYSFYPIDIHAHEGDGIDIRPLKEGVFPTIPLRALLPKNSRNLIAAGRCASGDQAANSAFRVQASCMAMGQVAGAVAALATRRKVELREVPGDAICDLLLAHDAIVPLRNSFTASESVAPQTSAVDCKF